MEIWGNHLKNTSSVIANSEKILIHPAKFISNCSPSLNHSWSHQDCELQIFISHSDLLRYYLIVFRLTNAICCFGVGPITQWVKQRICNIMNEWILINECVGTGMRKLCSTLGLRERKPRKNKVGGVPLPKVQTSLKKVQICSRRSWLGSIGQQKASLQSVGQGWLSSNQRSG